ncbi:phosphatase PAP2 family protein [Clostridium sp. D2Q-11]|uniref:Phosphatase PAP2 family protein n=1 Tax=Anaeromonas frigoriresistens TaxID=2683708 RepID=A0A942UZ79_9FIRM|nr:phosphatase PAP2 family protein [Anaeromonas frigoriresistens]MBS4539726.1 phosphatase PAP2 family protein [Anaeromonas frigoriresistens]
MQTEILMGIQKLSNPVLDRLFIFITNIGGELFYILALTVVYWCISKNVGAKMFTILVFSVFGNSVLKTVFATERPFMFEGINPLYEQSAPGYAFPSGHTQGTTTFWFFTMKKLKKTSIYILGVLIILLVGFSRLYLRVHWPIDVLGGLAFGILFAVIGEYIIDKITPFKYHILNVFIFSIVIPNILLIIFMSESNLKLIALISGALLGYFIQENRVKFSVKAKIHIQLIKFILGISILLGTRTLFKIIFPDTYLFDYLRYFAIGIFTTIIIPMIFIQLKLSKKALN